MFSSTACLNSSLPIRLPNTSNVPCQIELSIPDTEKAGPKAGWENKTGYAELHGEFPELVGEEGWGWLIRHVHSVCTFARTNPALVQKTRLEHCLELDIS